MSNPINELALPVFDWFIFVKSKVEKGQEVVVVEVRHRGILRFRVSDSYNSQTETLQWSTQSGIEPEVK